MNGPERQCPNCHGTGGNLDPPDEFGNRHAHRDCRTCGGEGVVVIAIADEGHSLDDDYRDSGHWAMGTHHFR